MSDSHYRAKPPHARHPWAVCHPLLQHVAGRRFYLPVLSRTNQKGVTTVRTLDDSECRTIAAALEVARGAVADLTTATEPV